VQEACERAQRRGLPLVVHAGAPGDVAPDAAAAVVRVLGEALTNVERHASAANATVELRREGDRLRLVVEDDGRGLDEAAVPGPAEGHFGLTIMRARASAAGGTLEVVPRLQCGTRVTLTVPIT